MLPYKKKETLVLWAFRERRPITGIAGCCARVASGHAAAAPPSNDMNSRRLARNSIRKLFGIKGQHP